MQDWRLDQELQHVPQNKQGKQLALRNAKPTRIKRYCLNVVLQSSALLVAIFQDVPLPKAITMPKIPAPPKKLLCAVTGLPAKYFDPVMFPSLLLLASTLADIGLPDAGNAETLRQHRSFQGSAEDSRVAEVLSH